MPTDFEELKRELLQSDEEFRQLATKHHDLDEKIHNYADRHYLTEPEQLEEVTLKKQKLQLKDQMESILRTYGSPQQALPRGADASDTIQGQDGRRRRSQRTRLAFVFSGHSHARRPMKIDRAGFPFIAGALVPAAIAAAARRPVIATSLRAARRLLHLFLPRSGPSGPAGARSSSSRRPTAAS